MTVPDMRRPRARPRRLIAGCAAVWTVSVVVVLTGTASDPVLSAAVQAVVVGAPMAVGLSTYPAGGRFPSLLLGGGVALAFAGLAASSAPLVYGVGRVAGWILVPGVVYVLLAFPTGHLQRRLDRGLTTATAATIAVLYVLFVPFTTRYPLPTPWATCGACPGNAFSVVDHQPAFVEAVIVPVREAVVICLMAAVTVVLARRVVAAGPLLRAALVPAFAASGAHVFLLATFLATREAGVADEVVRAFGWAYVASFPVVAGAFALGSIVRLQHAAVSLERLAHAARTDVTTAQIGRTIAQAMGDPTLQLLRRRPGSGDRWVDSAGAPADLPATGRGVTFVEPGDGGRPVLAFVHDPILSGEPEVLRAAGEIGLLLLANHDLVERLTRSLEQLSESRTRLLEAADRERRRIERDIHDGAQQRLVALRIRLSMLEERLEAVAPGEARTVTALGEDVQDALEQLRALARGVYPPLLAQHGLGEALRAAARSLPVPVSVEVDQSARYPEAVETSIYFACLEGLQNAAKHAGGMSGVHVAVREDGGLVRFEVRDDGAGFAGPPPSGSGLAGLRERIAAGGGSVTVTSAPGRGTRLAGAVPLQPPASHARPGSVRAPQCVG